MAKLRVVIVGAGRRVQNNFLPTLHCLRDHFEVAGVHSRTQDRLQTVTARWSVPAVPNLDAVDWDRIDVVAVSVTVSQNPNVLRQILPYASRLCLVIDTPVATTLTELAACVRQLPKFKKVVVTEDYMNFPLFNLIRQAMFDGVIGCPLSATLLNIGYYFHGLALIRSLVNFSPVWRTHVNRVGNFSENTTYQFQSGFRACVVGPYRPDTNGGILVEGTEGVITESASDARWGTRAGRPIFVASRISDNGQLYGYRLEDPSGRAISSIELPQLRDMRALPFGDKSDLNLCRGCGLMNVFLSLVQDNNINNFYGVENALYDSFVSRLASRGRLPVDPLLLIRSNVMAALELVAKVRYPVSALDA